MKKPVLVVMAAGMGSRYGGLKQIDPVDKEGHIIMDFSIYDAVQAGFGKVIFIIKKEKYVYKPTGKAMKKHKVYVAANQSSQLYDIIEQNKFDNLQSLSRSDQSNLSLEVFCSEDEQYALLQVMEFVPYNDVPRTEVKVYEGTPAKQIAYFLK